MRISICTHGSSWAWQKKAAGDWAGCYELLEKALTLPKSLGSGIWNRCKYVPYQFHMAECLEHMGKKEDAQSIYRMILDIEVEFFSNMHLRELPYYQALCAEPLACSKRHGTSWPRASGTGASTSTGRTMASSPPRLFFISFAQDPAIARRAYYQYLLGLVKLYEGDRERAKALFRESYAGNSDSLFCHYYAHL